jgi:hypothetical protein
VLISDPDVQLGIKTGGSIIGFITTYAWGYTGEFGATPGALSQSTRAQWEMIPGHPKWGTSAGAAGQGVKKGYLVASTDPQFGFSRVAQTTVPPGYEFIGFVNLFGVKFEHYENKDGRPFDRIATGTPPQASSTITPEGVTPPQPPPTFTVEREEAGAGRTATPSPATAGPGGTTQTNRHSTGGQPRIYLKTTLEDERSLNINKATISPIEEEFERDADTGAHAQPAVNPNTDPDSLRVGWVFGTHKYSVAPQLKRVPDTGWNFLNYGLGVLYSWRNAAAALDSIPLAIVATVNRELERQGIPLEALPADAVPGFLAERAAYSAARASRTLAPGLKLTLPGGVGIGFGLVTVRLGGRNVAITPTPRPPKGLEKFLTDRLQRYTDVAAAAARTNLPAFLGYNPTNTPFWLRRFEIGHVLEGRVGQHVASDPVLSRLIEPISYQEQAVGRGLLGDFRLQRPFQQWDLKHWDVTTAGGAWRKLQRGADRTWLVYAVY